MDGYAVQASDTYGASPSLPAYLRLVGEIAMGQASSLQVESGTAAVVHTGGMIPSGADAVVMLEDTQKVGDEEVEILKTAAPNQNVIAVGEDVAEGEIVIRRGAGLRPQEIGGLMALGITEIPVAARPRVGIVSTGDEIVEPGVNPLPGQIRDVNSFSLSALIESEGGAATRYGIVPDDFQSLVAAAREALRENDVLVISAGSSVSARDMTADVVRKLGEPGVLVHGVALRPGKPTILALAAGKPVLGLPGNPVSAFVVARIFLTPLIHRYLGRSLMPIRPTVEARLSVNIASEAGREDYVAVKLTRAAETMLAEPVFGKSNLIFTLVRADGLVRIPPDVTGLEAGSKVLVDPF